MKRKIINCCVTLAVLEGFTLGGIYACTIQGIVTNTKNVPLPYANVFLKDRFEGTISDENGEFSFAAAAVGKAIIVCSYIGYFSFEKTIVIIKGENIRL